MKMINKKLIVFLGLAAFVGLGIAGVKAPNAGPANPSNGFKNLQILPKDISEKKLDSIMDSYNIALGVKCNFCHVPYDKKLPDSLDYAADAEPMKTEARKMMRMVIDINSKNFHFDKAVKPVYLTAVVCKTCHRGQPIPEE